MHHGFPSFPAHQFDPAFAPPLSPQKLALILFTYTQCVPSAQFAAQLPPPGSPPIVAPSRSSCPPRRRKVPVESRQTASSASHASASAASAATAACPAASAHVSHAFIRGSS